jgi:hypothetical protein
VRPKLSESMAPGYAVLCWVLHRGTTAHFSIPNKRQFPICKEVGRQAVLVLFAVRSVPTYQRNHATTRQQILAVHRGIAIAETRAAALTMIPSAAPHIILQGWPKFRFSAREQSRHIYGYPQKRRGER